jgi:hypothetical protein
MKPQGYVPPSAPPSAHEGTDIHFSRVVRMMVILGVALVVSIVAVTFLFRHLQQKYPGRTSEAAPQVTTSDLPPLPRLQTHPLRDLRAVRDVEDSHLNHYGWIDRQHGIAQIPIDRAMVLWVKNCAATPPAPAGPSTNATPAPAATEPEMHQPKVKEAPNAP